MDLLIDYLASHPDWLETVARWHHGAWARLSPPGRGIPERMAEFARQPAVEQVPVTWVAIVDREPVGSVSLLGCDMDSHPELTPWLASLYVTEPWRHRGIGSALTDRALAAAARLGHRQIHLYTPDRAGFYRERGWRRAAQECYHGETVTRMTYDLASAAEEDPCSA